MRDERDMSREDGPLKPADDAVMIDTTGRTIDEVLNEMASLFGERCG